MLIWELQVANTTSSGKTLRDSEGQEAWRAAVHGVAKSETQLNN